MLITGGKRLQTHAGHWRGQGRKRKWAKWARGKFLPFLLCLSRAGEHGAQLFTVRLHHCHQTEVAFWYHLRDPDGGRVSWGCDLSGLNCAEMLLAVLYHRWEILLRPGTVHIFLSVSTDLGACPRTWPTVLFNLFFPPTLQWGTWLLLD